MVKINITLTMNTKSIQNTQVKSLPNFPILPFNKQNKTISKHFTNAALYLPKKEFALLNWLVYQSNKENSFKYNTELLKKFSATIKEINVEYGGETTPKAIQLIRQDFKSLIEKGICLPTKMNNYYLNPMLFKCTMQTSEKYQFGIIYFK